MDNIVVADKSTSQLTAKSWGNISLDTPAVVQMPVAPSQVASVSRNGQDLLVNLKNGEQIKVANFFNTTPDGLTSDMAFQGEDGTLWQAQYSAKSFSGFTFEEVSSLDELIAGAGVVGSATPAWAIAGLGLLGAGGAAAASGAGGGGSGGSGAVPGDTTAPASPSNLLFSADGTLLSGTSEAGATIQVRAADGTLLGSAVVAADGTFNLTLDPPQSNGQNLAVSATDPAGNASTPAQAQAPDTDTNPPGTPGTPGADVTPPVAPASVAISSNGRVISGRGEAGSTVTVTDAAGTVLGTGLVGADGLFSVSLSAAQTNGQVLQVTLTDAAGNTSTSVALQASDTTAPAQVQNLVLSANGTHLSGTGEVGARITVIGANGSQIGTGVVAANGRFEIDLSTPVAPGSALQVSQSDAAGNQSPALTLVAPEAGAPPAPGNLLLSASGGQLTGTAPRGTRIEVRSADGSVLGVAVAGASGSFTVVLIPAQANGEVISVVAIDGSGHSSSAVSLTVPDITSPTLASALVVAADGLSLSGRGEPGAKVSVTDANGTLLGTAVVAPSGVFTVLLSTAQTHGQSLQVVLTDAAGNPSPASPVTASNPDGPASPQSLVLNGTGTSLSGTAQAGSVISVSDANGNVLGSVVVGASGTFEIALGSPQNNGQTLIIKTVDGSGHAAPTVSFTTPDTQAPAPLGNLKLDADGQVLTGSGEINAKVTVRGALGTVIGVGQVGSDGKFSITLTAAQTEGQVLQVSQADAVGNQSTAVAVTAPDLNPPDAVTNAALSTNGLVVTGNGQIGATVTVTNASGGVLGSAVVGSNGRFEITLSSAQINGQTVHVRQTDGSTTASTDVPLTAKDLQAPNAPSGVQLDQSGNTVTGQAEPGAKVTVRGPGGAELGSGFADPVTGRFEVTISPAQKDGQQLQVGQTDLAGNPSPTTPVLASDNTPAAAPTDVKISTDGASVSGKGNPGDSIEVRAANGDLLGSGKVAANGSFVVTLNPAQLDGQQLDVTQTHGSAAPSEPSSVIAPDVTAPPAPTGITVTAGGILTGTTEPDGLIKVIDGKGDVIATATAGPDGKFTLTLPAALNNGQPVQVIASDGRNDSTPVASNAADNVKPAPVDNLAISPDGSSVSGTGEAGTQVTVSLPGGAVLGTGTVGADGVFVIGLKPPAANGSELDVISTDAGGNASTPVVLPGPDGTQLATPSELALSGDGFTLTGAGTPGSTVTVVDGSGASLGSGRVDSQGRFSILMRFAQLNAQTLHVTATDASGHTSVPGMLTAGDTTAPDAPSALTINAAGSAVTGRGEAGATVTITDSSNTVLGSALVASNGTFTVTLSPAQLNAQPLKVTQSDIVGNVSPSGSVIAPDLQAPPAPSGLTINSVGTVVSGQGEAGASVTIRGADGNVLATGTVDPSGQFQVTLPSAVTDGSALQVTLADALGHISAGSSLATVDRTPPVAVKDLFISATGATLTGTGEAGATVKVSDASGTLLGSALIGSDGSFSVTLSPAPNNGQTLDVSQTDRGGNVSPSISLPAPDLSPPAALTQVLVNADGVTVTGRGEPGAKVSVRDVSGVLLGTGAVASDGSFSLKMSSAQINAQVLTVTQEDPPGNVSTAVTIISVDQIAPDSPAQLTINGNGLQLSGTAEAGSTVTVRDAAGLVLGTATAGANGAFQVNLASAQQNGQSLSVTSTDAAGNVSAPRPYTATDGTAPGPASNLALSADGLTLAGNGEPGASVVVRDASGNFLGTATVGPNGSFNLPLNAAAAPGTTVNVILTDAAGNASTASPVTAPGNLAEPAPLNLALSANGFTLTGTATAGSTVSVRSASGTLLGTALVGSDGSFSATLNAAQLNGEQLSATATSGTGISSLPTAYLAADVTDPAALSNLLLGPNGATLSGQGEVGATVTVLGAGGAILGTAVVGANGAFTITFTTPQNQGQSLSISQTDKAGNESTSVNLLAKDLIAPQAPANLVVSSDGSVLTGTGEANAAVKVYNAGGQLVGSGNVRIDGSFEINLSTPQANGQLLSVTLTDAAGNASLPGSPTPVDTTAPIALTQLAISSDGATLSGRGEAGATITVSDSAGNTIGTGVVSSTGSFTLVLDNPVTNAEVLKLVQTDAAGNVSPAASIITQDSTAPAPLLNLAINPAGSVVTGSGEPGATVTIKDAAGKVLGSDQVRADGSFAVTLSTAQINKETLSAQQADPTGNISTVTTVVAPDLTPPALATNLKFNSDGGTLGGNGEVGATVSVTLADGREIGVGKVAADGSFLITLSEAQTAGQPIFVVLKDVAGNASAAANLFAPDTTAPGAVGNLAINAAGTLVSGTGEAGASVFVSNPAGAIVGTGSVGANGSFSLTLSVPQTNGELLSVIQRDPAGNPSAGAALGAPDITPPAAPVATALSTDGLTLSGTGEAGATVRVLGADGGELGTTKVDTNGLFSLKLESAQLNGQTLTLTQTDVANNLSATGTYKVLDVIDPAPVSNLAVSLNGLILTGNGEPGAKVNVSFDNALLGSAIVAADGTFSVDLKPAQLNGQLLSVTQLDSAGNDSTAVSVPAPDSTPPAIPVITGLVDGITLQGTAEAGSTVVVRSADGTELGRGVALDGSFSIVLTPAQINGQLLSVVASDAGKNPSATRVYQVDDTQAPTAVSNLTITADYTQLAGRGEAGASIVVTNAAGDSVGTGTVAANGTFTIDLASGITADQRLTVVQTDKAGNDSAGAELQVPVSPAPDAPTNLQLAADGITLTGNAAQGTRITVYGPGGAVLGTGTTGADGTFSLDLTQAQTNGQNLGVTASTIAGGASLPTALLAADTSAPAALTELAINGSGNLVTGRGEAGSTVTITTAEGASIGSAVVGANGTFSATLTPAQANGQLLSAFQTDRAGLESAHLPVTAPDITAPTVPVVSALNAAGLVLSGSGEAGATVTVRSASGAILGTAKVASDGSYAVTLSTPQLNGQVLSVSQKDLAGNVSEVAAFNAGDTTAPGPLSNLSLNPAGLQLSGSGEAGATVRVTNAAGDLLGSAVVGAGGSFTVALNAAQLNGQVLSVRQSDPRGNASETANLTAADIQAPTPATGLGLAANGLTISGSGEAGAKVNVFDASGAALGTGTVGSDGKFSFNIDRAQLDGQALTVRLVDTAGNVSTAVGFNAPDTTAPAAPSNVAINASGLSLTGTGVAGSSITVRNAAGLILGTATVAANGSFTVALSTAQIGSELLSVTQADSAGNVSAAATTTAPDLTAPEVPGALLVNALGTAVSGTGEAGATVTIRSSTGSVLGTTTVGQNGEFSASLNPPQINGEKLSVSLTDAKGNVSAPGTATAPDVDAGAPVVASDNLATATVILAPVKATQYFSDSFATLLSGFSKTFAFTVNSGTTVDPTLNLTTTSLVSLLDGVVYALQVKSASGAWVTLDVNGNGGLLDLLAIAGQGVRVNIGDLQSGDYRLTVSSTGIGLLTTVSTDLKLDITSLTQFTGTAGAPVTGNVILDAGPGGEIDQTGPDQGAQLQVLKNGSYVTAGAGVSVQGLYGTLTLDSSGHYSYTPNGAASSVGKVDVFNYQLVHSNGLSDSANLYVRIDSPQATEIWSDSNLANPALLLDATNDIAVTDITVVPREITTTTSLGSFGGLLGGGPGVYTTSVAGNTVSDLTVVINSSNLLSLLGSMTVGLYKLNITTNQYVLVKSYAGTSLLNLGGGNYGVKFDDQTSGTYQVKVAVTGLSVLNAVNTSLINVATYTNQSVVGSYTPVAGNLLTDTAGAGADIRGSDFTSLSVLAAGSYVTPGYNGTTVVGTYGSLLVQANGSYTYTLTPGQSNAIVGHEDVFYYKLTHPNGSTDIATLTIDLHQAGAAASTSFAALASLEGVDDHSLATLAGAAAGELIQGTDGNDTLDGSHGGAVTLQGGAGNDTLIIADQTFTSVDGGSGSDTLLWAGGDATINLGDLQSRIHNIEVLDLNQTSAVSLTVSLADLVAVTSADNNTLLIKGGTQDSVHMTNLWSADGTHQAGGIDYTQYTPQEDPSHHLWVQNGIQVV